jgi:hypothetical protein
VTLDDTGAPPPPPGPGVNPPFPAPPVERNRRGLWIGLGLGALALVVCCGGGLFGFGVLVVNGARQVSRDAEAVVGRYFQALVDRDYDTAYEELCPRLAGATTPERYAAQQRGEPRPIRFVVDKAQLGNDITVPTTVAYDRGGSRDLRVVVEQVPRTREFKVCGGID